MKTEIAGILPLKLSCCGHDQEPLVISDVKTWAGTFDGLFLDITFYCQKCGEHWIYTFTHQNGSLVFGPKQPEKT